MAVEGDAAGLWVDSPLWCGSEGRFDESDLKSRSASDNRTLSCCFCGAPKLWRDWCDDKMKSINGSEIEMSDERVLNCRAINESFSNERS